MQIAVMTGVGKNVRQPTPPLLVGLSVPKRDVLVEDREPRSFLLLLWCWWLPIVGIGTLLLGVVVKGEMWCGARVQLQQG